MFKAIQRPDRATLRTLAKAFIRIGDNPAALLCLDHFFSSPRKLRNLPFDRVQASLSLYLEYVDLLDKLRRDVSLAKGSARQRLFGFQVLGGNRYLVPEYSSLYKKLANQSGSSKRSTEGHACNYNELGRSITHFVSNLILDRTKVQDGTCRDVHGFAPCLELLVQKECTPWKEWGHVPSSTSSQRNSQLTGIALDSA
jgi:hypothetical protein